MKRIILGFAVLISVLSTIAAQSYNTAFGLRLGEQLGFGVTQRIANHTTLDFAASNGLFSDRKYLSFNLRQHYPVITKRINFFIGAGAFSESYKHDAQYDAVDFNFDNSGISAVMGAEITLGRLNLAVDYMPKYIIRNENSLNNLQADSAFSIKYVLWKRKGWLKRTWEKIF